MTKKRFFIYGSSECPFCMMACDFLAASSEEYYFFDFCEDPDFLEYVKEFHSFKTVPVVLVNDCETGKTFKIGGYEDLLDWANL